MKAFSKIAVAAVAGACLAPSSLFACAACYGQSNDPLASGMNWGIFTLLGVVVTVLGSIASFFVYLIRKETAQNKASAETTLSEVKI